MDVELGEMGTLPFAAVGSGAPLVFLAGLWPESGVASRMVQRTSLPMALSFSEGRRVVMFNRRPRLPRGMTIAELAGEHAEAIMTEIGEAVDVVGTSTGGSIAQQLAADHPETVRRLVLVSTACRLGDEGRRLQRRVAARLRRGANRQAFAVAGAGMVPRYRGQLAAGVVGFVAGPRWFPNPDDLADMATTIEAEDRFDLAACRRPIEAPTLIVAGARDQFYGPALFNETARLIPNSRLRLFEGRGHITVANHPEFAREIREFLAG
ncbi:MAG TPA: alpha/beta fold hydrolase [Conexibacter sp.]|jgi:pimeloyl-ACP methyl ester carboxylesterase